MLTLDKEPPHSDEIEIAFLGGMCQHPVEGIQLAKSIPPAFFYVPAHKLIFNLATRYFVDHGKLELFIFQEYLKGAGHLESIGGPAFLTSLWTGNYPAEVLSYYVDILRDKCIRRELIQTQTSVARMALDESEDVSNSLLLARASLERTTALAARANGKLKLAFRTPAELISMELDDTDILLGDRLLARGQPLTLLGQGGIGKSRLLLQLLICMITGRNFGPLHCPANPFKWLIFQTENSNRRLRFDLGKLRVWLTPGEFDLVNSLLSIHTLESDQDYLLNLELPESRSRIEEAINHYQPEGVCFDPLYSFGVGDINKDSDMIETVLMLASIVKEGNPERAIIVLHHALTGQAGAEKAIGRERASFGRNSKALQQWTRGQINIAPINADNYLRLVLSCGKNSNGREFEPFEMALSEETLIYEHKPAFDATAWYEQLKDKRNLRKIEISASDVADLAQDWISRPDLVKSVMAEFVCQSRRARYAIENAEEAGLISFSKSTRQFIKTTQKQ